MSVLAELRRRNVHRIAAAYLAGSWLLIQVLETLFPIFDVPETSIRWLVVLLGAGFVPAMVLSWLFEITPEGIRRDKEADPDVRTRPAGGKSIDRVIIALMALALGYFIFDKFYLAPDRYLQREEVVDQADSDLLPEADERSIAVLPFVNMSSDPEQEYFADGVADEILGLLAQVPELRVISRSSSFSLKGQGLSISEIANRLSVVHVLEGSVRTSGAQVRVTVQLIDARTDSHVWSETFDRTLDDVFAIQDEISARVLEIFETETLFAPRSTEISTEAYGMYLRARHIHHSGQHGDLDFAERLLQEALELEPEYIPALSELARVHLHSSGPRFDTRNARRDAVRELVARISALAPESTVALGWRAWIAWSWDNDPQFAAHLWERALAQDPGNSQTLRPVAPFLADLGRFEEAIAVARYVLARDPLCSSCLINLSAIHRMAGSYEEAERYIRPVIDLEPDRHQVYWSLGSVLLLAGKPAEALAAFDLEKSAGQRQLGRIMALHDLGRLTEFEEQFAQFRSENGANSEGIARIYAWVGDKNNALVWLERLAQEAGSEFPMQLGIGFYEKVVSDPRYQQLLQDYGIESETKTGVRFEFTPPARPTNDSIRGAAAGSSINDA